jgi:hypothetical protein
MLSGDCTWWNVRGSQILWAIVFLVFPAVAPAGPLLPPAQVGSVLKMTNANVRLEYDLSTGRANFYWQNALRISGFYAGVGLYSNGVLTNYLTGTVYTNRTWTVNGNEVEVTSTRADLPTIKQFFFLDQDNSFLTRVDVTGTSLQSRWMGPVVMDMPGGVDIGAYNDNRALIVPFDNDSFTFSYDAMSINNTSMSYEASAFYDNTTRNGLVVGSVTHDLWKTGVYFQGVNNRLNVLNVFGGVTSTDTRDISEHGLVHGDTISSPTVFIGFGADWRATLETYADANTALVPRSIWTNGVPFGWNSWYAYTTGVNYSNATAASTFVKNNLQTNHFHNRGVVYLNLDSFWSNFSDSELQQFANFCHANNQKAGIYWTPFVYWGTASQGSNSFITGSAMYKWSSAYLRTVSGEIQTVDGGIALDPTHPGFKQLAAYYMNFFKSRGFDFLKLDFLSHGALEGTHYDTNIVTGIQAYNQGMQYLVSQNNNRMFLSAAISPIFPYQYTHSRRIYCDASTSIGDTAATMQAVTYGWWINNRLYSFSDPDMMKFAGATTNENQSRLINCAVAGTLFLNSDDLASTTGQDLARRNLTNAQINEIARAGVSFRPAEGNTGTAPADVFVRQDGSTWYVAVFNYTAFSKTKILTLARLGITGVYTAMDLWSGAVSVVNGSTWNVNLGARQAKLFRLGSGNTAATGPTNQPLLVGGSATLSTTASGTPPFSYVWLKNGVVLPSETVSSLTINPVTLADAGTYTVSITGPNGSVTNSATLSLPGPTSLLARFSGPNLVLNWPAGYTGWRLQSRTSSLAGDWSDVNGSTQTNSWIVPLPDSAPCAFFRLVSP